MNGVGARFEGGATVPNRVNTTGAAAATADAAGGGGGTRGRDIAALLTQLVQTLQSLVDSLNGGGGESGGLREESRNADGSGNNPIDPDLGTADSELLRRFDPDFADGTGDVIDDSLPSAREVSNAVFAEREEPGGGNAKNASDMFWQWGQFLDHDLSVTPEQEGDGAEEAPIAVPRGDPQFDPRGEGDKTIPFTRSEFVRGEDGVRNQTNSLTAFIDGSNLYGSDEETTRELRSFEGGRLREGPGGSMPKDEEGKVQAGDDRAGEQPGLTSMHALWVREHNRIADFLAERNPGMSDEELFQEARRWTTAEMQQITYDEFLPMLLGEDALGAYEGYDPNVDPSISASFSTAAFRFGHSMVSPDVQRLGPNGEDLGSLSLAESFMRPELVEESGIEPFLRGLITQEAQELDDQVIDELRNMLFGPPGAGGLDLTALNIQRGRDHGMPSFNDAREAMGLRRIESFDDPIFRDGAGARLAEAYDSVDDIELWVGGLAERPTGDAMVGDTFKNILVDQFERLRSGDRFWFENQFSGAELESIKNTTLGGVIERNTDIRGGALDDTVMQLDGAAAEVAGGR